MTHIPDQSIVWRVKNMVQGNSEFCNPKPSAKVASGLAHTIENKSTQLIRQRLQLCIIQMSQICRRTDSI
jgi:hypothetical protein